MSNQKLWAVVRNEKPDSGLIIERVDGLFSFVGHPYCYTREDLAAKGYKFIASVSIEEAFDWVCDSGVKQ
jgi:hypothetical protein